ncbi:hypothetical protein ISCGN_011116 [Ixodes scapularis]
MLSSSSSSSSLKPADRSFVDEALVQGVSEAIDAAEDHFEPSQFQTRCSDGWRRLKATAVPSLFLHSESQQPAARTSGAALQGGLLTQPLPTTSGACFVTSDNQRGQASAAALGTLVSAASTSWMSRKIKQLENENHRLVRQAALQKTREATFRSHLHKFFTADQLAALSRSSNRGSKWSNETVKKSLQMRFACGSLGYDLLLEGSFPLPSSRTLGRRLEGKFVVRLLKCFKAPC